MEHFTFLETDRALSLAIQGEYNFLLVALSLLVAITATYTSFLLSERIHTSKRSARRFAWLVAGSLSLGGGVWAMHFIGMLAYRLPVAVHYDVLITIVSILPSLFASLMVLNCDCSKARNKSIPKWIIRSVLMGGGIGLMHYTGMAAMHMDAEMRYHPGLFSLSIVVAVVLAMVALRIKQWADEGGTRTLSRNQAIVYASIVMGVAISAMHYTGMAAVYYFPATTAHTITKSSWAPNDMALLIALVMSGVLILLTTLVFISRRLALMARLQASETRLNTLFDTVVDALITIDGHGLIESFNPAAEKMFGYDGKEVTGKSVNILMPESKQAHHDEYMRHYHETGEKKIIGIGREEKGRRKDGSIFPMDLAISEATVQGKQFFIGSIRDITERKQIQQQLEEQSQVLQQVYTEEHVQAELLRFALQPTKMKDYLENVLATILELQFWLELKPKGAVFLTTMQGQGQTLHLSVEHNLPIELHSLCARVPFGKCLCGRAAAERSVQFADCVDERHDIHFDGMAPHDYYSLPLIQGDIMLGVMVLYLPHGHQQGEREIFFLQQVAEVVSLGINRRYTRKALVDAKEEAESAARAKSNFLATMSHEIRTPMNGVLGMLHLLGKSELDSKQRRFLNTASGSGEMLLTVINDILDFSKIEADSLELESIPFDPVAVVEETASLLAKSAHEKGLELICSVDTEMPRMVKGDPTRLRQVLTNLINNAIKFTENGNVAVYANYIDDRVCFGVVDTGIGISEEQQKNLFKAFTQVDSSHTRKYGGTGLGLVISRRLVAAMGGELRVASAPSLGADFSFELPLEKIDSSWSSERVSPLLSRQRILLVDDNKINREVLNNILKSWHIEDITEAEDGPSALAKLQTASENGQPYDIGLLDMQMPGMDGLELAQRIRKDNSLCDMHLVMLSSVDRQEHASELDVWLTKPVRQSDLFNSLMMLLGDKKQIAALNENCHQDESLYFGGRQLLLVEDNLVNQEVAEEILSDVGFEVDIRENGVEALQAVQEKSYDVVLMDIQMPVMDGLEATRQIRALADAYRDLPIIAMTAHALTGDADKSLEAGMNAHVTKPIDPDKMFSTIAKWIEPSDKPVDVPSEVKQEETVEIPDLPGINVTDGLNRMRGKWSSYKRVLTGFRDKQADSAATLKSLIQQGNWDEAATIAHGLKGSGGNIGAETLYKEAAAMEQACRGKDSDSAQKLMSTLQACLEEVINSLKTLDEETDTSGHEAATVNDIDPADLQSSLNKLMQLLDSDISAAQSFLETLQQQTRGSEWSQSMDELLAALNRFDIDAVKTIAADIQLQCKSSGQITEQKTGKG